MLVYSYSTYSTLINWTNINLYPNSYIISSQYDNRFRPNEHIPFTHAEVFFFVYQPFGGEILNFALQYRSVDNAVLDKQIIGTFIIPSLESGQSYIAMIPDVKLLPLPFSIGMELLSGNGLTVNYVKVVGRRYCLINA